jgi:hypothetical protein
MVGLMMRLGVGPPRLQATAAVFVASLAFTGMGSLPAWAQCQAPAIEVHPAGGGPGRDVTITGQAFMSGCTDELFQGEVPPPDRPQAGIRIVFVQGDRVTPLATVDAGPDYTFTASVAVPESARPGRATVRAASAYQPVDGPFTVLAGASAHSGRSSTVLVAGVLLLLAGVGSACVVAARIRKPRSKER